jgi:hypothetical protein
MSYIKKSQGAITFNMESFSKMTLNTMALSIADAILILSIDDYQHNDT